MTHDTYYGEKMLVSIFSQPKRYRAQEFQKNLGQYEDGSADVDLLLLKKTFEGFSDQKNITIHYLIRKTGSDIETHIRSIDAKNYDKFIFVFLTYQGTEYGLVHVQDSAQYQIDKIFDAMTSVEELRGKPKLILVQADDDDLTKPILFTKGGTLATEYKRIPSDVDRLILTSSIPQNISNIPQNCEAQLPSQPSSLMIRAFCEVVEENRKLKTEEQRDMFTLAIDINHKVTQYIEGLRCEDKDKLEVPLVFSSLTHFMMI